MIRLALRFAVSLAIVIVVLAAPARANDPQSIAAALKQGGYVIVFRHGATDESQKDVYPFRFDDMRAQRQLSDKGREMARAIGMSLKELGIPVGEVYTSRLNRAVETGKLIAAKDVTPKDDLTDSGAGSASSMANPEGNNEKFGRALRELAGAASSSNVNILIVTHKTNIADAFGKSYADVQEGEALIFRPTRSGPEFVARAKAEDWAKAARS
jgi:broad specificity phosphatase PhoE